MLCVRSIRPFVVRNIRVLRYSSIENPASEKPSTEVETDEFHAQSTEHRDKLIFDSILDSVLMRAENQSAKRKPHSVTSTVQALFDNPQEDPLDRAYGSILDKRTRDLETFAHDTPSDAILKNVQPVLEHISSLKTNKDVVYYHQSAVIRSFETVTPVQGQVVVDKTNAAYITKHIMAVLIDEFKDPVGALHIFNSIKAKSNDYFIAACSADVYNRIIALRWQYYRDIQSVVSLMNEMFINAVQGNNETVDLLGVITRQAIESSQNIPLAESLPLWSTKDDKLVKTLNSYRVKLMSSLAGRRDFALANLQN
ncbi:Uncharacterized protein C5D6.12 [Wickerhamiella sorbophila]|uniref:Uncharacterized protein C5D6.12 n=1 Tax=Wickerhamiella sorbophila TaxID=45607 RepID=A0A2T0FD58_9ASCO|nr:Uncharacterized protein C5D6.12 [Wickerhamiella sorbophila]PRT52936.1 Uncharacterized protein C5D6.12 [Wickerhamiella sorbophila]